MAASATTAESSVLLIEEYDALAVAIESALTKFAPRHRIVLARSLAEARSAALAHKPQLIILDFDPPHPNAIAFFAQLESALPNARVLLIAAENWRELKAERGGDGGLQFLEKPFELVDFGAAVQALLGPWRETSAGRGTLHDFSLVDAVVLGCLGGRDAVIQVQAPENRSGQIYLHNGHIAHAATSEREGPAALTDMLTWQEAAFAELPRTPIARQTFQGPWTASLLQAMREAKEREPSPIAAEPAQAREAASEQKPAANILVIDDTEMLLIFVEDSLKLANPNFQITTAPTGLQGVKEAERVVPDLILCDYSLPDIKGDEVCRRIGASERTGHVPVVMMSGHVHEMADAAVKLPNVVATIAKPFLSDALVAIVQQSLKQRPVRDGKKLTKAQARAAAQARQKSEGTTKSGLQGSALAPARPSPSAEPKEVLLDIPLDVVAMEVNSAFQVGLIRARPASPTVAIQIPALAARAALPLETSFTLGRVDLDARGRISIVRLVPTTHPFQQVEMRTAFSVGGVTVVPANESERLQLISAGSASMTMQLFAPLELMSVEFSENLELKQLVLRCRSDDVRVTLNARDTQAEAGATFRTTAVQLDETGHVTELTLAPV